MADSKLVVMLKLDGTDLGKGISRAQADIAKIGTAFTGAGLAAGAAVKFAAEFQDTTIKAARAAGMASQAFSSLAYAAGLGGVSADTLGKSMSKLQNPTDDAARTFRDLGIQMRDASGKVRDQEALLGDLADKFERIDSPVTKSQAAIRIFGEEGAKMVSVLEGGSKSLSDARKEAYAFGQTVSEQAGKNAEQFNDNLSKVTKGLTGFRNVVSESAIEMANQSGALEAVQNVLKSSIEWWRSLSKETQNTILKAGAIAAGFGAVLLALSAIAAILPSLAAGFKLLTGPVGVVTASVGAMTMAFNEYREAKKKGIEQEQFHANSLGVLGGAMRAISAIYDEVTAKIVTQAAAQSAATKVIMQADEAKKRAEEERNRRKKIKVTLSDSNDAQVLFKSEIINAVDDIKRAKWAASGATEKQMQRLNQQLEIQNRKYYDAGQQAVIAYAKVADAVAKVAGAIIKPFSDLTDTIAKGIEYDSQVALRDLDVVSQRAAETYAAQKEAMEAEETAKIKALEDSYDKQIAAVKAGEDAKTQAAQFAADQRLLAADEEYRKQLDALNAAFAAQMEADRLNYEMKMAELDLRAIDREQRQLTETIMEEDARLLKEQRESAHEKTLADLAKNYADKKKGIDDDLKGTEKANSEKNKAEIEALTNAKNLALEAAEAEKNAKLKKLDEDRAAQEKALEKQRLETQYKAQLDAFNATKGVKIAETVASGAAAAAQAFNAMAAALPFGVGVALGGALAATILGVTAMRVGQINSQQPIKPAGLLEDGGFIGGSGRHMNGTDYAARVESGEFYIDRGRSAKMLRAIDNGIAGGGGVQITFQAGAIQGDIRDERTMNMLAVRLGNLIQRQMVTA